MTRLDFRPARHRRGAGPVPVGVFARLGLMVALLVVVMAVMLNPGLLYRGSARVTRSAPATRPRGSRLPPGTVRIVTTLPSGGEPAPPPAGATRPATRPVGLPTRIDAAIFNDVKDLDPIEARPYYEALAAVLKLPRAAFDQPGLPRVRLADLFEDPDRYRGRLVTIRGNLRRLRREDLGKNEAGLDHVYVAQVRDPRAVSHIYALVLVEDPRPEVRVGREVTFTGVFFKVVVGRDARGTLRRSPLIVGRRLKVLPGPPEGQYRTLAVAGAVVGLAVVFLLTLAVLIYRRGDRKFERRFLAGGESPPLEPTAEEPAGPSDASDRPAVGAGDVEETGDADDQP